MRYKDAWRSQPPVSDVAIEGFGIEAEAIPICNQILSRSVALEHSKQMSSVDNFLKMKNSDSQRHFRFLLLVLLARK